ncbi:protein MpLTP-like66 [Marchantia polymorpha subsp. ruderalis]|uniref:Bifunctional inhibitor/plant lipid transfer protein/seed storage helical domain-containing protein n=2 Tax=Marchantia polymorpha TaxID=3197 RepID=A0A176WAJ7_MARPO|nr:hypothetical protein AXG93_1762s1010 [Marchantia polymorpha subsp. ruderalis]PTQ29485.1 hypothetical protein MARPO_0140s0020 [Marchantia polymorpha]BBN06082.1 hypothetical protein Mp_3g18210 [Marchantia polymorpha subsp. ruderalis]|eukprot:PTQ29485.1 hypothetical protein MARPO_0140s0020 [Marchantia polymorpha]
MDPRNAQLAAFVFLAMVVVANAQACPGLTSYASCLQYGKKGNAFPPANSPCCQKIRTTSEKCLCDTASNNNGLADFDQLIQLPQKCGRTVPKGTYCRGKKVPGW